MVRYTTPIRIFRSTPQQTHNLNVIFEAVDIYGEDKWGRLIPDESALIAYDGGMEFGVVKVTAMLLMPKGLDADIGYFIQVKSPRVVAGSREACVATTAAAVLMGDTTIAVDTTIGFQQGDTVLFSGNGLRGMSRVATVQGEALVLYGDSAAGNDMDAGATITACSFYRVLSKRPTSGPVQTLIIQRIEGTGGMG